MGLSVVSTKPASRTLRRVLLTTTAAALTCAAALLAQATTAAAPTPQTPASAPQTASPTTQTPAAKATAPAAPTAPLQVPPANFDIEARSNQVLAHLSAVIRYYRTAVTPIQKVGEPTDALYREEAVSDAKLIASYAFQSGIAEAKLLAAYQKLQPDAQTPASTDGKPPTIGEAQKLQATLITVNKRTEDLKTQQKVLEDQLDSAKAAQIPSLRAQIEQVQGALQLNSAMSDALSKIVGMSDTQGQAGLAGDIEQLSRTAPELTDPKSKVVPTPLENLSAARSAGVSSQATVLFQLLSTRRDIDQWTQETDALHAQALALRTPVTDTLRGTIRKGQALSQQAADGTIAPPPPAVPATPAVKLTAAQAQAAQAAAAAASLAQLKQTRATFDSITATFKVLSDAAVPLSQEIITLEQSRANLVAWRLAVDSEYHSVLRSLLLRILVIAIALGGLFIIGEIWRRATVRYVHDLRRRRQFLGMRRVVIGFLSGLVLILGFVNQFNSLATFAGFITAGIAVGLQTILLSVAAYFFIIGRYGVRVGDRITVAGVTGDVIEVGLVRFYMMELGGNGLELQSTGRVAVFSNAILFQAGTPLYKQMPGTYYAWQELTVKLQESADYRHAAKVLLGGVEKIYAGYKQRIEQQHEAVQAGVDAAIDAPTVESRVLLVDGGLQLLVRFPVEIRDASLVTQQVSESMLALIQGDEAVKQAVAAAPVIKAAVKG